jgi:GT2 family glycosyltransferase
MVAVLYTSDHLHCTPVSGPRITVVVPTLGNHSVLRRVLDGYERQIASTENFELLVVADSAEPDPEAVRELVRGRPYPARLLQAALPGASANRNTGWRSARAPIVAFTDNDTIPTPRFVSEHLAWHERFPASEVVVLGLVRWAPGVKVTPFMKWLEHGVQFDYASIPGTEAGWAHVYSSNCSIKRSFLERVGGYDEQRLPYGYEDLDWGYRAREHGLRVVFNRHAVVDHWRTMTVQDWQARAPRLALTEWTFCRLHPDVPPWFQRKFADAAARPSVGRRAATLVRFVPRRTPWIGRLAWERADVHWRQQIAPYFLETWAAAAAGEPPALQPAVSALAERASSGGS